jgi:hypothetical protein
MKELKEFTVERLNYLASLPRKAVTIGGDELASLAKIALAAKQDETLNLPLDYLQGHKDGLEWAARTAEACNPLTSDWLYDEPEKLAAAIRKGPEMPPLNHAEQDGWTKSDAANAALVMLDRIETIDPVDDDRIEGIKRIIHQLASAPKPESE